MSDSNRYYVEVEVEAPSAYNVGQVAAAVGLAFSDYEGTQELTTREIHVRHERGDA